MENDQSSIDFILGLIVLLKVWHFRAHLAAKYDMFRYFRSNSANNEHPSLFIMATQQRWNIL